MRSEVGVSLTGACLWLVAAGIPFIAVSGFGADLVEPSRLREVVKKAAPGAVILVKDGTYVDQVIEIEGKGEETQPIVIRSETPGGVIFTGKSGIELKGSGLVFDGFWFAKGQAPEKYVIAIEGTHCCLTNTVIDSYNPADLEGREDKWVSLKGQYLVVDHCTFHDKRSKSVTLTVWRTPGVPDHHTIELNHFHVRPRGNGGNGYETIRIGTSEESESDSLTTVRSNLFEQCDGEMEAVSVKAGNCHIHDNTFSECAGTLTLRHGNGSRVEKNLFSGKRKEGTGGVRVYGVGHSVTGNAFIGLTGRGGAALSLMAGEKSPKLSGFQPVENVRIEGNLFAANVGPAIRLDEQYGDGRVVLPKSVAVRANVLSGSDLQGLVAGGDRPGVAMIWEQNQIFSGNQIPASVTSAISPPLMADDVGAPWFRDRVR